MKNWKIQLIYIKKNEKIDEYLKKDVSCEKTIIYILYAWDAPIKCAIFNDLKGPIFL